MLKVGIIGTGIIAREHAHALRQVASQLTLVSAADASQESLDRFGTEHKVRKMSSSQLIESDVDLVTVTTPPVAHEDLVIAALKNGKCVLCEKPLAHTLDSAKRIAAIADQYPGKLAVSHQLRYDLQFQQLAWICRGNHLGKIIGGRLERHGLIPHATFGKSGWWGKWSVAGGGVLMTQMIHQLDLLICLLGLPLSIKAQMDTRYTSIESEDWIDAQLIYDQGTVQCTASVNSGRQDGCFELWGEQGKAQFPFQLQLSNNTTSAAVLAALYREIPEARPASQSLTAKVNRRVRRQFFGPTPILTPHARLYADIAKCISTKQPLPIGPAEAMKSLELCLAAYQSAISGQEIKLPLAKDTAAYQGITPETYARRPAAAPVAVAAKSDTALSHPASVVPREVTVGLIGLDTTHATTFSSILNDPYNYLHIPGARVVAGYAGGSPDMEMSIGRVPAFTAEVRDRYGVAIKQSPAEVAEAADLVFILSCDARVHLPLLKSIAPYGKPIFVDKPMALSYDEAVQMFDLAEQHQAPLFATSGFRYTNGLVDMLGKIKANDEKIERCEIRYWLQIQPTQGRYYWYGIHASEMAIAVMGPGVAEVHAQEDGDSDTINVRQSDGRTFQLIGSKSNGTFSVRIWTDRGEHFVDLAASMGSLSSNTLWAVLDNLTRGTFPRLWTATDIGSVAGHRPSRIVDPNKAQTLDVIRVLDMAQRSLASGQPITD
jgi:predicted dehydrogenase